ncbi:hypothetical protein ACHAXT_006986 [Thalassiosira profunda]
MAKLSLVQRVVSPKSSSAKKNLLKRHGITSDGAEDDDSSSLSDRQGKGPPKGKKKFDARKFFRRMGTKSADDEDGYESDASTGSTRSTSSSFLRYQSRALWKSKFTKKSILQRLRDGSETPVEEGTRWPLFDRIYKRQNKKGENEEDDEAFSDNEDDGSACSDRSDGECPLAPPAPIYSLGMVEGEEVCLDEDDVGALEQPASDGEPKQPVSERASRGDGVLGMLKSLVTVSSGDSPQKRSPSDESPEEPPTDPDTVEQTEPAPDERVEAATIQQPSEREPQSEPPSRKETVQESGIPTYEMPKQKTRMNPVPPPQARPSPGDYPTQKPTLSKSESLPVPAAKPPRPPRQKRRTAPPDAEIKTVAPRSTPQTICYSLRSAIGDGSARQRNSHSLMERRPLRPNGSAVDVSYWSHRGKRNYMEDRFVIEHIGSTNKGSEDSEPITLLAVFDGHGGATCSQFCSDWISSYIRKKNEHYPENLPVAVKNAFIKMDMDFTISGQFDGTTACACTIVGKKVVCCNAGDSRAIIVKRDGTAVPLSEDHKPDRDDETKRINDLGGRVIHWGRWRVEGVLAVSRSIGDSRLKPYVTAEPDIVEHEIGDDDMFLVVASDGVWDTMSSDLVAKFCLVNTCRIHDKSLHVDDRLLRWIARQISKRASSLFRNSISFSSSEAHSSSACNPASHSSSASSSSSARISSSSINNALSRSVRMRSSAFEEATHKFSAASFAWTALNCTSAARGGGGSAASRMGPPPARGSVPTVPPAAPPDAASSDDAARRRLR